MAGRTDRTDRKDRKDRTSAAALQRAAPLALRYARELRTKEQLAFAARQDALSTDRDPVSLECNAAYCCAIYHLALHPGDASGAVRAAKAATTMETVRGWIDGGSGDAPYEAARSLAAAFELLRSRPPATTPCPDEASRAMLDALWRRHKAALGPTLPARR